MPPLAKVFPCSERVCFSTSSSSFQIIFNVHPVQWSAAEWRTGSIQNKRRTVENLCFFDNTFWISDSSPDTVPVLLSGGAAVRQASRSRTSEPSKSSRSVSWNCFPSRPEISTSKVPGAPSVPDADINSLRMLEVGFLLMVWVENVLLRKLD